MAYNYFSNCPQSKKELRVGKRVLTHNEVEENINNVIDADWAEEDTLTNLKVEVQEIYIKQEVREENIISEDTKCVVSDVNDIFKCQQKNVCSVDENSLDQDYISDIPKIVEVNIKEEFTRVSPIEELERHVIPEQKSVWEPTQYCPSETGENDASDSNFINKEIKQETTSASSSSVTTLDSVNSHLVSGKVKQSEKLIGNCKSVKRNIHSAEALPKPPRYICSICKHVAKKAKNLKMHYLVHKTSEEAAIFNCAKCSYKTKYKGNLTHHMLCHKDPSEVKMYKCNLCQYESKRKKNLRDHMLLHKDASEVSMHKCELCLFKTKRKQNLKDHMNSHKGPSELIIYKCDVCSFETKHRTSLNRHKISHKTSSEVQTFRCDLCPFTTRHKSNFKAHMLSHQSGSELPMYKCDLCSYQSKFKRYVAKHMTTKSHLKMSELNSNS